MRRIAMNQAPLNMAVALRDKVKVLTKRRMRRSLPEPSGTIKGKEIV
jgi:hypothetical protein